MPDLCRMHARPCNISQLACRCVAHHAMLTGSFIVSPHLNFSASMGPSTSMSQLPMGTSAPSGTSRQFFTLSRAMTLPSCVAAQHACSECGTVNTVYRSKD